MTFAAFIWLEAPSDDGNPLSPNKWGDLVAGFSAFMAFVWFIAAFRAQSKQLEVSSEQLWYQRKELERSGIMQQRLSIIADENLTLARRERIERYRFDIVKAQPIFKFSGPEMRDFQNQPRNLKEIPRESLITSGSQKWHCSLSVDAGFVLRVSIRIGLLRIAQPILSADDSIDFWFRRGASKEVWPIDVAVHYVDRFGSAQVQRFRVSSPLDFPTDRNHFIQSSIVVNYPKYIDCNEGESFLVASFVDGLFGESRRLQAQERADLGVDQPEN